MRSLAREVGHKANSGDVQAHRPDVGMRYLRTTTSAYHNLLSPGFVCPPDMLWESLVTRLDWQAELQQR